MKDDKGITPEIIGQKYVKTTTIEEPIIVRVNLDRTSILYFTYTQIFIL